MCIIIWHLFIFQGFHASSIPFIIPKNEYLLATRQFAEYKSEWIGVRNVVDKSSSDHWAKIVGWYVASIDGKDQPFSLLSDALKAYDSHTVKKLGVNTKETDLNLPGESILIYFN